MSGRVRASSVSLRESRLLQRNRGTFTPILYLYFLAEVQMAKPWTTKDVETLRMLAQQRKASDIASELGRSPGSTAVKAHQLGISLRYHPESAARSPQGTRPASEYPS